MTRVREWKPGDVVVARVLGEDVRGIVDTDGMFYATDKRLHGVRADVLKPENLRPLAVIDPESDDVERLASLFISQSDCLVGGGIDAMQAALREFADPKPRIEEPTGLGAVVEDANGTKWLLVAASLGPYRWAKFGKVASDWFRWSDITAVRVLSEGVTV